MRVFLADDQSNVRSALKLLLEQDSSTSVVGEVVDSEDLLAQAEMVCPDLLLIDWGLPGGLGDELLPALRKICPDLYVIALSGWPEVRLAALAAGADAFVSKADPPGQLLAAIEYYRADSTAREKGN